MPIFKRGETKGQMSVAPPPAKAAAAGSYYSGGASQIGQYYAYNQGTAREMAMRIPAVSRARDLHASVISAMGLKMYREVWNEQTREMTEEYLAPRAWLRRPDPQLSYEALMAWTLDDLFFLGRAFWAILSRTADGYPASFTRLPAAMVTSPEMTNQVWVAPANELEFNGLMIDPVNVVQFISPVQGIVYASAQTIATALKIEDARFRNASSAIPAGILRQTGGEPLSAQELRDLAAAFNEARATNQTAALNEFLSYETSNATPDKMLLIESANYSALEMARLCNIPPYLLGVSTGSYSYQSSEQARMDLYMFGTKIFAECVASTLSSDQVLPRGTYVEFDTTDYLGDIALMEPSDTGINQPQQNTQEALA